MCTSGQIANRNCDGFAGNPVDTLGKVPAAHPPSPARDVDLDLLPSEIMEPSPDDMPNDTFIDPIITARLRPSQENFQLHDKHLPRHRDI